MQAAGCDCNAKPRYAAMLSCSMLDSMCSKCLLHFTWPLHQLQGPQGWTLQPAGRSRIKSWYSSRQTSRRVLLLCAGDGPAQMLHLQTVLLEQLLLADAPSGLRDQFADALLPLILAHPAAYQSFGVWGLLCLI